jgi:hypothetical protein
MSGTLSSTLLAADEFHLRFEPFPHGVEILHRLAALGQT